MLSVICVCASCFNFSFVAETLKPRVFNVLFGFIFKGTYALKKFHSQREFRVSSSLHYPKFGDVYQNTVKNIL